MDYTTCPGCGYAMLAQCDNPACLDNPNIPEERKEKMREAHEKSRREAEAREALRRVRRLAMGGQE